MPNPNRTVLLKGDLGDKREEARAAEAISPGMLIEMLSDGTVQKNDTVTGNGLQVLVALEDPFQGRTIDDDYAADDLVSYHVPKKNDKVFLRVPAAASAIVKGAYLQPAAGGTVVVFAAGVKVARAEEALDNSAGAEVEWVMARII
jgi:hypothetical protein